MSSRLSHEIARCYHGRYQTTPRDYEPLAAQGADQRFCEWPGAGSNRRPSDFQSDARTN